MYFLLIIIYKLVCRKMMKYVMRIYLVENLYEILLLIPLKKV